MVLPKDIGVILAFSGVGKNSLVIDAGAGSGWLAIALANTAKKVVTYEWREEFASLCEKNAKRAGVEKTLLVKRKDAFKGFEEKNADLVTLDMADSDKLVKHAYKALKKGGMVFGYLPHVGQAQRFFSACEKSGFEKIHMVESIMRNYLVRDVGIRPENTGLTHTAYIVFAAK